MGERQHDTGEDWPLATHEEGNDALHLWNVAETESARLKEEGQSGNQYLRCRIAKVN